MKKTFLGSSLRQTFLGTFAVIITTTIVLIGCNKETKEKESSTTKVKNVDDEEAVPANKKVIYLTFDDGPNRGTENLLKILHKRNICATAFVVGKHTKDSKKQKEDFVKLKTDSLIELANHSYTHALNRYSSFYKNPEAVVKDFDRAKDTLKLAGKIARTPGRNIWRFSNIDVTDVKSSYNAANSLKNAGYKVIGWDLEWRPTKKMTLKNHEAMLKKVDSMFYYDCEKTSKHLVFLTHDQYLNDADSINELDLFIEKLQKSNRFVFRKISSYPKINKMLN